MSTAHAREPTLGWEISPSLSLSYTSTHPHAHTPTLSGKQKVTLDVRVHAGYHMLSWYAFYERNIVHHFNLSVSSNPWPQCHTCEQNENNSGMGLDKWELINQHHTQLPQENDSAATEGRALWRNLFGSNENRGGSRSSLGLGLITAPPNCNGTAKFSTLHGWSILG